MSRFISLGTGEYLYKGTPTTSDPFYRVDSDNGRPWSVSFWCRPSSNTGGQQTLFTYGDSLSATVWCYYDGGTSDQNLKLRYGTATAFLQFETPAASLTPNVWSHVFITYDGGTTGDTPAEINDYYGRFEIWINGTSQSTTNSNGLDGYTGVIPATIFQVGAYGATLNLLGGFGLDEFAWWDDDQTANITNVYNNGETHDLSLIDDPPLGYWQLGDGDTSPTFQDSIASDDLTYSGSGATILPAPIQAALYTRLSALTRLSGRAYSGYAPQSAALPYVVFHRLDDRNVGRTQVGSCGLWEADFQVNVYAEDVAQCLELVDDVREDLDGLQGTTVAGIDVRRVSLQNERDTTTLFEGSQIETREVQMDFLIIYKRTSTP